MENTRKIVKPLKDKELDLVAGSIEAETSLGSGMVPFMGSNENGQAKTENQDYDLSRSKKDAHFVLMLCLSKKSLNIGSKVR